ncbi:hydantoinase B/oxoprolinase family protein [Desulfosarcina ovata]|uniref:N-methylhydantoinase n=1 Tax=Desulfosarcina ovata subsp. ovata TaxID=2752305 RepID=A0A5K8AHT4_9BACT|nr:hydantoinase B/oxoprolinase family protein [Desulfosarcina ovata]BBO92118.1 N-methylhydantoinase [Desulfosarcina ovata subsp. ovata]
MKEKSPVDPITFEVIRNQLVAICNQMGTILRKTSYSPILYDMIDFSNSLHFKNGDLISQADNCPTHIGAMHISTREAVNVIGIDNIAEGDIIISNDPYQGGTHIPDIIFTTPIYYNGSIVGFASSRGHWIDLGGAAAGISSSSRHLVEDGLVIVPTKIYSKGEPISSVINFLRANTRMPQCVDGDINAFRATLAAGVLGVKGIFDRYGEDVFYQTVQKLFDYTETRTRNAIRRIPNGQYRASDEVDCDGISPDSVHIEVSLTINDDEILIDFEGTGPVNKGSVNSPIANTYSAAYYALKFFLDPDAPQNSGYYRPIKIKLPEGIWINAAWPASTRACTTAAGEKIADVIWKALAKAIPERVNAANYGVSSEFFGGSYPKTGGYFVFGDLAPGGWGATPECDGMNVTYNRDGNCMDLAPETAELFYPVFCERREFIPDSGGAGKYRGGLGMRQTWKIVGSKDVTVSQMMTGTKTGASGINMGKPGRPGKSILNYGEKNESVLGGLTPEGDWKMSLFGNSPLNDGDSYTSESPGGGGWGNPLDRDAQSVLEDILDGIVTPDKAKNEYGVVLTEAGDEIDYKRTTALRESMK